MTEGLDLSVGAVLTLASVVLAMISVATGSLALGLLVALGVAWQHAGSANAYDDGSHPQDMEQLLTTVTKDVDGYWTKQFAAAGLPQIQIKVEVIEELGSDAFVFFALDAESVVVEDALSDQAEDETSLLAAERDRTLFVARVDPRTKAKIGETLRVAIDPSRFYFFSPETGETLLGSPTLAAVGA